MSEHSLHTLYSNSQDTLTSEEVPDALELMKKSSNFFKACRNVSKQELEAYAKNITVSDQELREIVVATHWSNPICNICHTTDANLQYCDFCCLVFYCSQKCEEDDWNQHRPICCNSDAFFDTLRALYRPVIVTAD